MCVCVFELFATQQRIKSALLLMTASGVIMMIARLRTGVSTKAQDGLMIMMILRMIHGEIGEQMLVKKGELKEHYLLKQR